MPYSQSWLEDSTSIRGILIELTVKTISTIVTTAGGFTIGTSYVIKTIGSKHLTQLETKTLKRKLNFLNK